MKIVRPIAIDWLVYLLSPEDSSSTAKEHLTSCVPGKADDWCKAGLYRAKGFLWIGLSIFVALLIAKL